MSKVKKALEDLQHEIANQKDRLGRIRQLDGRRELLLAEIEEGSIASAADYETKHKALLGRFVDGDLTQKEFGAANRELEKERVSVPNQEELLRAIGERHSQENSDSADSRIRIGLLQNEYRTAVFDSTVAELHKRPGLLKGMRDLVILASVCQRHEDATIEQFIDISPDELSELTNKFEHRDLLLGIF